MRRPSGAIEKAWARARICRFDVWCGWIGIASRCAVEEVAADYVLRDQKRVGLEWRRWVGMGCRMPTIAMMNRMWSRQAKGGLQVNGPVQRAMHWDRDRGPTNWVETL